MRSRSVGGIARKRKEVTSTSEVISANSGDSAAPAAARRPPLPVIADTKAKKGRKEVTFGSEARDRGQQRRERSLNEPPPASERGNARERRRAEREDVKKAASTTSKVRDECGDGASSEAAADVDGESVPGANSGEDH